MKNVYLATILLIFPLYLFAQNDSNLPEDFPDIQVNTHNDPEPGYIFLTPCGVFGHFPDAEPFLAILDNFGTPIYYLKLDRPAFDFKLQPNGLLSYNDGTGLSSNVILDSSYNISAIHGVSGSIGTDFHEFRVLDNGNYLMLGYDDRTVDMDTVVPGGHPGVTVRGACIQENDHEGNLVWEWSSWDHFKITDAMDHIDLTDPGLIDYVHANALDQDTDSTMLICSRNMFEITKINKNTGDIIWRLGGKNNQFTSSGDTVQFSGQHHIRRLENGNYLLFDNGWNRDPYFSCAVEFQLDEFNKVATLVKEYRSQPEDISGYIMGSSQRLPGGNTLVGWGSGVPNVTEFKPDGSKALEFEFESVSYRAYKFPWKTNAFTTDKDTIDFGEINSADSSVTTLALHNNLNHAITINNIESHSDKFTLHSGLPVEIPPNEDIELDIVFRPGENGEFNDLLTLCNDIETEDLTRRIARQVWVRGTASEDFSIGHIDNDLFSVHPNPTEGILYVEFASRVKAYVDVSDLYGRTLVSEEYSGDSRIQLDITGVPPGIYLINIFLPEERKQSTFKILKH